MQEPRLNWAGEPEPTEDEQLRWSRITVIVSVLLALLAVIHSFV